MIYDFFCFFLVTIGTLLGATRNDPIFKSWLKNTDLNNDIGINKNNNKNNNEINFIEYLPLADRIVKILEILLENHDGMNFNSNDNNNNDNEIDVSNLNWIFKEYELIDLLINQVRKDFLFFLNVDFCSLNSNILSILTISFLLIFNLNFFVFDTLQ